MYQCILFLVALNLVQAFTCPEPGICECASDVVSCICNDRQNVTLDLMLHFSVDRVLVHRCGTVIVPLGTLLNMNLNVVEFVDIEHLSVNSFGLTGADSIATLHFENIANFEVKPMGFSGLSNITSITVRNVTSTKLQKGAFGQISEIKSLLIENSTFETVEPLAFLLTNVTSFRLVKTNIGTMSNASLLIHNGEEVAFTDSFIENTMESTFVMAYVDKLTFTNCTFGTIATEAILAKNLQTLTLVKCNIKKMESNAFSDANVLRNLRMHDNIFELVQEDSLFPNLTQNLEIDLMANRFTCDCKISWLLTKSEEEIRYKSLIQTSACVSDTNRRLEFLSSVNDVDGNCVDVENTVDYDSSYSLDNDHPFYSDYISSSVRKSSIVDFSTKTFIILLIIWVNYRSVLHIC